MSLKEARAEVMKLRLRVMTLYGDIDRGRPLTATEKLENLERAILLEADNELAPISGRR